MIVQLNKIIPSNTIAVPLYSQFSISYRNSVSSPNFLNDWIYDKNYILEILQKSILILGTHINFLILKKNIQDILLLEPILLKQI